jgi:hypothetical protein
LYHIALPLILDMRKESGDPNYWHNFEWLAMEVRRTR